jgi:hypothetical protein
MLAQFVHSVALRFRRPRQPPTPKSHQFNTFPLRRSLACKVHFRHRLRLQGKLGCLLMNWSGSTTVAISSPKKKRTLLPLLTVIFIVSYALMTMLIIEQGAAIQSQSNLIKILMPESHELWTLKGKAIANQQAAKAQDQAHAQNPSAQTSARGATAEAPSAHAQSRTSKAAKPQTQFPPIPASELDPRRAVRTI